MTGFTSFQYAGDATRALTPVEVRDVDAPWHYPDLATALRGMASSGVAAKAAQHSGEDALMAAMAGFLKPLQRQDGTIGYLAA